MQLQCTAGHQAVPLRQSGVFKCSFNAMGYPALYVHFYTFTSSQQLPKQIGAIAALSSAIFQTQVLLRSSLPRAFKMCWLTFPPHAITPVFPIHCGVGAHSLFCHHREGPRRCDVPVPVCFILTFDAVRSSNPMSWQLQRQLG